MVARDVRLSVKLTEDKHGELKGFAESYGVSMSSLSAYIIGQWLHHQKKVVEPMGEGMKQVIAEVLKETIEQAGSSLDRKA